MPLYVKDGATTELVARAELDRVEAATPLRERFAALRSAHPLPARSGELADKAFYDDLSGEN